MSWLDAVIYGLIQGLSEFLPVSSSGHLALLPHFMNINDPGVLFDLMMHIGTGLAIIVYFHKRIIRLIRHVPDACRVGLKEDCSAEVFYIRYFVLSTICSVILILILKNPAEFYGRNHRLIAFNLIFFGLLLFLSDKFSKSNNLGTMESKNQWRRSILIGLSQALAIFPGVSRSGITITTGRFLGLSRLEASSYSFLLSLPIIFAGAFKEIPHLVKGDGAGNVDLFVLLVGIFISFLVGILTIHFFLKLIARISLGIFFIYRVMIAILVLVILH